MAISSKLLPPVLVSMFLMACATRDIWDKAGAPPPQDYTIVPGQRIGPVYLGMSPSQLWRALGSPSASVPISDKRTRFDFRDHDLRVYVSMVTGVVDGASTSSPRYTTKEGVKAGATELELLASRGLPQWKWPKPSVHGYGYSNVLYCYRDATNFDVGGPNANDVGRIRSIGIGGCQP